MKRENNASSCFGSPFWSISGKKNNKKNHPAWLLKDKWGTNLVVGVIHLWPLHSAISTYLRLIVKAETHLLRGWVLIYWLRVLPFSSAALTSWTVSGVKLRPNYHKGKSISAVINTQRNRISIHLLVPQTGKCMPHAQISPFAGLIN